MMYPFKTGVFAPAAFRRLCVETKLIGEIAQMIRPAAFRRLCVETAVRLTILKHTTQPPSGGCVLKPFPASMRRIAQPQPPSGGCVLKLQARQP